METTNKKNFAKIVSGAANVNTPIDDLKLAIKGFGAGEQIIENDNSFTIMLQKKLTFFAFTPSVSMLYKQIDIALQAIDENTTQMQYSFQQRNVGSMKVLLIIMGIVYGGIGLAFFGMGLSSLQSGDDDLVFFGFMMGVFFLGIVALLFFLMKFQLSAKTQDKKFHKIYLKELTKYLEIVAKSKRQQQ